MNTLDAVRLRDEAIERGALVKIFDWVKAAKILKERNPAVAHAGLREDWENTAGVVWMAGKPVRDTDCYLASVWATPCLAMFMPIGANGSDVVTVDCWETDIDRPEWTGSTLWPEEAMVILGASP